MDAAHDADWHCTRRGLALFDDLAIGVGVACPQFPCSGVAGEVGLAEWGDVDPPERCGRCGECVYDCGTDHRRMGHGDHAAGLLLQPGEPSGDAFEDVEEGFSAVRSGRGVGQPRAQCVAFGVFNLRERSVLR